MSTIKLIASDSTQHASRMTVEGEFNMEGLRILVAGKPNTGKGLILEVIKKALIEFGVSTENITDDRHNEYEPPYDKILDDREICQKIANQPFRLHEVYMGKPISLDPYNRNIILKSPRGTPLVWQGFSNTGVVTVENYDRWLELFIVSCTGLVVEVPRTLVEGLSKQMGREYIKQNIFHPDLFLVVAEYFGCEPDRRAMEMAAGRWVLAGFELGECGNSLSDEDISRIFALREQLPN